MYKPILAIDFDGVICDSMDECIITALNACNHLNGEDSLYESLKYLDEKFIKRFRQFRHFIRSAEEYFILAHHLQTSDEDLTSLIFKKLKEKYPQEMQNYAPLFYQARNELRKRNTEKWEKLHRRYEEAAVDWDEVNSRCECFIVTDKDLESVSHFDRLWELNLQADRIWARGRASGKPQAVMQIAQSMNAAPGSITFIDDHPQHLRDTAKTGAKCAWASWGYHKNIVKKLEFPSLKRLSDIFLI